MNLQPRGYLSPSNMKLRTTKIKTLNLDIQDFLKTNTKSGEKQLITSNKGYASPKGSFVLSTKNVHSASIKTFSRKNSQNSVRSMSGKSQKSDRPLELPRKRRSRVSRQESIKIMHQVVRNRGKESFPTLFDVNVNLQRHRSAEHFKSMLQPSQQRMQTEQKNPEEEKTISTRETKPSGNQRVTPVESFKKPTQNELIKISRGQNQVFNLINNMSNETSVTDSFFKRNLVADLNNTAIHTSSLLKRAVFEQLIYNDTTNELSRQPGTFCEGSVTLGMKEMTIPGENNERAADLSFYQSPVKNLQSLNQPSGYKKRFKLHVPASSEKDEISFDLKSMTHSFNLRD